MRACAALILFAAVASGAAHAAPPTPAPPRPVGGAIGAAGPIIVEGYAPDRRWVAICQAREDTDGDGAIDVYLGYHGDTYGDDLVPYLVVGDGDGRRIDAFVGASADGRWVAFVEERRLVLWDSRRDTRLDLTTRGALGLTPESPLFPGFGGFDPSGSRYLYHRGDGPHRRAVVIDPATGVEHVVDHGLGNLYAAYVEDGGQHAGVLSYPAGARLRLPYTSLAPGRCRGPITSYSSGGASNLQRAYVRVHGPGWHLEPLAIVGGRALFRSDAGALTWDEAGALRPALPPGVDGRVLAVGRARGLVIAIPTDATTSAVHWFAPDGRSRDLGWTLPTPEEDAGWFIERVWSRWAEDRVTWLVDLDTGDRVTARFEADLEGSYGSKAFLMSRSDGWAAVADLATGAVVDLPITTAPYRYRGVAGPWALAKLEDGGNVVVDLAHARVAGAVAGPEGLGLSDDGLVLTPTVRPGHIITNVLPLGPLRWYAPAALADAPR
ncbi:MAG: hypothetical protein CVU56_23825 [Deltaproteobacteria bacterium HGW-Deltaproteobacteria-14]|jgi:hypothetical protein|nr:MAG: hypothetical protein CVU56_23825 [Deltaproteobacteria bacterium HGW-Deltaproteobacteria-14]